MRLRKFRHGPKLPLAGLVLITAASAIAEFPSRGSLSLGEPDPHHNASKSRITEDAQAWIDNGLSALAPDEKPLVGLEIVSDYEYFTGDGQKNIHDITRITLPSTLWQERHLEGGHVRRGIGPDGAFMHSPRGEVTLEPDQEEMLATYLCLRRLPFLSFCPELTVDVDERSLDLVWLRVERKGTLFARIALDAASSLPVRLEWDQRDTFSEHERITTHFSDYRSVNGWKMPHTVESFIEGEPFYVYYVRSASVRR